jgi:hypothetical protein
MTTFRLCRIAPSCFLCSLRVLRAPKKVAQRTLRLHKEHKEFPLSFKKHEER